MVLQTSVCACGRRALPRRAVKGLGLPVERVVLATFSTTVHSEGGDLASRLVQQTMHLAQDGVVALKPKGLTAQQQYQSDRTIYRKKVSELRKAFAVEVEERVQRETEARRRAFLKVQREKAARKEARREGAQRNVEAEARKRVLRWEQLKQHWAAMQVRGAQRQARYDALKEKLIAALEKEQHMWLATPTKVDELISDVFWAAPGGTAGPGAAILGSEYWRYVAEVETDPVRAWVEREQEKRHGGIAERHHWLHARMRRRQQAAEAARAILPQLRAHPNDTRRLNELADDLAEAFQDYDGSGDESWAFDLVSSEEDEARAEDERPPDEPDEEALQQFEKGN